MAFTLWSPDVSECAHLRYLLFTFLLVSSLLDMSSLNVDNGESHVAADQKYRAELLDRLHQGMPSL